MKKIIYILSILAVVFAAVSCSTTKEITPDLSAAQIMQMGQDAYGRGDYVAAEYYYKQTLIRYGLDTEIYVEARYEIGHIAMKTKDYVKAYAAFREVIDIYNAAGGNYLTPSYKVLALKGIEKIPADVVEQFNK